MDWKPKKEVSDQQLLKEVCKFAAYQERCIFDIEQKLEQYAISEDDKLGMIDYLIDERFLDEERFTKSLVLDKFKFNKWGKDKIKAHLNNKNIPNSIIERGLSLIDSQEYLELFSQLGQKKWDSLEKEESEQRKVKTMRFLASKGFEPELIYRFLDDVQ